MEHHAPCINSIVKDEQTPYLANSIHRIFTKTGPFLPTHILTATVWAVAVPHPLPWLNKSNLTLIRSVT